MRNRSQQPTERTDEERERDRQERERRRAAEAGERATALEASPALESGEAPTRETEQVVEAPGPGSEQVAEAPAHVSEEAVEAPAHVEEEDRGSRLPADEAPGPRPRAVARGGGPGRHRGRIRLAAVVALLVVLALIWFLVALFQPFHGPGHGRAVVVIPQGSSTSRIGSILAHDHVVSSGTLFQIRALLAGKRSDLRPGRFVLERGMSYSAALAALTAAPPLPKTVKITIPEGETRLQISKLAAASGLRGSYLKASEHSELLSPAHYGAPKDTPNLEGFLFPDTYELDAGAPASQLVADQLEAFKEDVSPAMLRRAHALHVTAYQLITVASMIEREAQVARDRPLISAVIYNRLRRGMSLGIDATIYYAVELKRHIPTYGGPLGETQLHIDSPYNTRTHKGLTPTPISNPGLASLDAAAHPAHVAYLYYVLAPDGCGEHRFSNTEAEFERNVVAYEAALAANHGHLPACRHKP